MFDRRLIAADVLKLRRRTGMLSISVFLTLGVMAIAFVVMSILHANDPAEYGAAGGLENYRNMLGFLGGMTFVVGAIVGGTAGTQDLESGVFRDLAATGRSRTALFASRVAGALVVVLSIAGLAALLTGAASVALAEPGEAPGAGALIAGTVGVLVATAMSTAVAVGLSVLVSARGPVIGLQLAFYFAIAPLLLGLKFLGAARQALPEVAASRIADLPPAGDVQIALATAVIVVIAWSSAALGLGAWRTRTREI
jgi:hypothetical protein